MATVDAGSCPNNRLSNTVLIIKRGRSRGIIQTLVMAINRLVDVERSARVSTYTMPSVSGIASMNLSLKRGRFSGRTNSIIVIHMLLLLILMMHRLLQLLVRGG